MANYGADKKPIKKKKKAAKAKDTRKIKKNVQLLIFLLVQI